MARTRRISLVCGLAGFAAAALSQPAVAGVARLAASQAPTGPVAKLIYRAVPGERNDIYACAVFQTGSPFCDAFPGRPTAYVVARNGGRTRITPGPGCQRDDTAPYPGGVRCPLPEGMGATGPLIDLGDGNDSAQLAGTAPALRGAVIRGGSGNDAISGNGLLDGGGGNDVLTGDAGPNLIKPRTGQDLVYGGMGADRIQARDQQADIIYCSDGRDRVTLDWRDLVFDHCERVWRDGAPRAIPTQISTGDPYDDDPMSVLVGCPDDMPTRACVVVLTLTHRGGRRAGRARLRVRRGGQRIASLRPTGLTDHQYVLATVWTLRGPDRPLKASQRFWVDYPDPDEVGDG